MKKFDRPAWAHQYAIKYKKIGICYRCKRARISIGGMCSFCYELAEDNKKGIYLASYLLRMARKRAKQENLPFNITHSFVKKLIMTTKKCPLLNISINFNKTRRGHDDASPSLDQIFSGQGYTQDNTWLISWRANRYKSDATLTELNLLVRNLNKKIKDLS